jgi:hypothetical protein
MKQGRIYFFHPPGLELGRKEAVRFPGAGQKHNTARLAVKPMDRMKSISRVWRNGFVYFFVLETIGLSPRAEILSWIVMDADTGGLIDPEPSLPDLQHRNYLCFNHFSAMTLSIISTSGSGRGRHRG